MNYFKQYRLEAGKLPKENYNILSLFRNYYPWKASVQPGKSPLDDGLPWMTFDAIRFLRKNLKKNMNVFEYGSGGSSIFFSQLAGEVVTVEHNKNWFMDVKKKMETSGITNWTGFLSEPEKPEVINRRDFSDADVYATSDYENRDFLFVNYVKTIDRFPDRHFDLVVIDGRSRPSCIKHSVPKVKNGGYILLDNADRESYQPAINKYLLNGFDVVVNSYGPTSHNPEFTMTKIWKKK